MVDSVRKPQGCLGQAERGADWSGDLGPRQAILGPVQLGDGLLAATEWVEMQLHRSDRTSGLRLQPQKTAVSSPGNPFCTLAGHPEAPCPTELKGNIRGR